MVIVAILSGCANRHIINSHEIQGADHYSIDFEIKYNGFHSGKFTYGPAIFHTRPLANTGICCYTKFHTLYLDFTFDDGRTYHEEIELLPLLRKMSGVHDIPDMRNNPLGHSARITVYIHQDKITIDFRVRERFISPLDGHTDFKSHIFPVMEKILIPIAGGENGLNI